MTKEYVARGQGMDTNGISELVTKYRLSDSLVEKFYNFKGYNKFYPRWMELRILIFDFIEKHINANAEQIGRVLEIGSDPSIPLADFSGVMPDTVQFTRSNCSESGHSVEKCIDIEVPFMGETEVYDCIVCTEVLEHLKNIDSAIANMRRLLRPDGLLLLTTPVCFRPHGHDYQRLMPEGVEVVLRKYGFYVEELLSDDVMYEELPLSIRISARKRSKPTILFLGAGMKVDHIRCFLSGFRVLTTDSMEYAPTRFIADKSFVTSMFNDPVFTVEFDSILQKECVDIVMPVSHYSLNFLMQHSALLSDRGITAVMPGQSALKVVLNKRVLHEHLLANGYQSPTLYETPDAIQHFPVIVKPSSGTSSVDVYTCGAINEVMYHYKNNGSQIIQEYIKGVEYTVDVYCNPDGTCVKIVPRKRTDVSSGLSVTTQTIRHEKIMNCVKAFVSTLELFGPLCIQIIETADGELYIVDVNPRVGGGTSLSIEAGMDIPGYILENVKGQQCPYTDNWKDELLMSRYFGDMYYEKKSTGN